MEPADGLPPLAAEGVAVEGGPEPIAAEGALGPLAADAAGATPALGYELPTARQVVGRGLQLAFDASRDIRSASLYIGLLLLAVAGPFIVLLVANLSRIADLVASLGSPTDEMALSMAGLIGQLYAAGLLAGLGAVAVAVDGTLTAVALLGGRAAGRPLRLGEAVGRSRQIFWTYLGAAFVVGILTSIVTGIVSLADGAGRFPTSIGSSILASFVSAAVGAPFGYILTSVVVGDVGGLTAVRRSVTLARARPALAVVIAAFVFLAQAIQVFGTTAALGLVGEILTAVNPTIDLSGTSGQLVAVAIGAIAVVAYGSLTVTVGAISAAPQVIAFLGLTHFSGGLDRARTATPRSGAALSPGIALSPEAALMPGTTPPPVIREGRWVTRPMLALIGLSILVVGASLLSSASAP